MVEEEKTPIEKLLNDLSKQLDVTIKRNQTLSTAIRVLSNLKNNPVDGFNNPLSKQEIQVCMDKCNKILADNS